MKNAYGFDDLDKQDLLVYDSLQMALINIDMHTNSTIDFVRRSIDHSPYSGELKQRLHFLINHIREHGMYDDES